MAEDKNIFETAASKLGKKSKKGKDTGPVPLKPVPDQDPKPLVGGVIPKQKGDPETQAMLQKIRTMQADLQQKFDALYKKAKMTPTEFKNYLDDPKNFSKKEWDFVQSNRYALEEKVWDVVGLELKPATGHKRENISHERKGKTLGARKKWIPMQ